jgi:hypothetical protein
MSTIQSIESIEYMLSRVKRFTWSFTADAGVPMSVACLAFSVEEAKHRLLSYLVQIESLADENKSLNAQIEELWNKSPDSSETLRVTQQMYQNLYKKLPPIEDKTAPDFTRIINYSRYMPVEGYIRDTKEFVDTTLGQLISTCIPDVEEIRLVTFSSSL